MEQGGFSYPMNGPHSQLSLDPQVSPNNQHSHTVDPSRLSLDPQVSPNNQHSHTVDPSRLSLDPQVSPNNQHSHLSNGLPSQAPLDSRVGPNNQYANPVNRLPPQPLDHEAAIQRIFANLAASLSLPPPQNPQAGLNGGHPPAPGLPAHVTGASGHNNHEREFEIAHRSRERAFICASRRKDRCLSIRMQSARNASKCHYFNTGCWFIINEDHARDGNDFDITYKLPDYWNEEIPPPTTWNSTWPAPRYATDWYKQPKQSPPIPTTTRQQRNGVKPENLVEEDTTGIPRPTRPPRDYGSRL
ncbi:hypothetical protein TESG_04260 [Trichophyton tonsurans CBS 112818]|uniref:Uncharacterized protein n=1 Tax=Trichophyton tonsurans (strain CBS 112818) TaxID=647933 RepID=F2S000_TRIT1|nr:hypothetical protein TESG_04260 [Trichophyton tonsurans CBS 112818]